MPCTITLANSISQTLARLKLSMVPPPKSSSKATEVSKQLRISLIIMKCIIHYLCITEILIGGDFDDLLWIAMDKQFYVA